MLQFHQVRVDFNSDWLLVIFNGCSEYELEEVVEHEGSLELVCFAEHEKI